MNILKKKKRIKILNYFFLYIMLIMISGCATGKINFRKAEEFKKEEKYIEAIEFYMKAVKQNPNEARYRLKLMEVMIEASNHFYRLSIKHKREENFQLALLELNKALEYNPSNNLARFEKKEILKNIAGEENKEEKTWIEHIKEKTSLSRSLLFRKNKEKISLKFTKKVELKKIFKTLAMVAGINIIFDSGFKSSKLEIKLDDIILSQALERICLLKNLFYKVLDENTIIIIPDTSAKRKIYDEQIIKSYFLSNIKAEDCLKLIRKVTRIKNITADSYQNTITVREHPERVALVERLIRFYDKRKAAVMIKIDIMEVNKDRLQEYGVEFSQYQISQSMTTTSESGNIKGNRLYYVDSSDFTFSIPTVLYKFLESDSDSREIARPQVRGEDGEKIEIKLGDKVPVPRTTFIPFATGGAEQQPITSYDLQDVGIDISIVPHVHHNAEISLELDFKLTFITSPGTTTLPPTIGNRSVKTRIRLKDGETGIMVGLLKDSERRSKKGFPGISKIPILGSLFSSNRKQAVQTDIIIRVTPYILRMPDIEADDLLPIESGTESNIKLKIKELKKRIEKEEKKSIKEVKKGKNKKNQEK